VTEKTSLTFEDFLKEIWQRRWSIVATTFLVALATAVVSLFIPKVYQATAQLIVLPPRFKPELASQAPEVKTCQMLLGSPAVLRELLRWLVDGREVLDNLTKGERMTPDNIEGIRNLTAAQIQVATGCDAALAEFMDKLDANGLEGLAEFRLKKLRDMTLEDLGEIVRSEVAEEKKTAIDIIYSPIIVLRARGRTGAQAAVLANAWGAVFLKVYSDLVRRDTDASFKFISAEASRLQKERAQLQEEIRKLRQRFNLEFLTARMEADTHDYGEMQSDLARQRLDLDEATSRLATLARTLNAIEDEGAWIGATSGSVSADKVGVAGTDREARLKVLASAQRWRNAAAEFEAFSAQHDLDTLRKKRERAQIDLLDLQSMLRQDVVRIERLAKALETTRQRLQKTSPTITVRRPSGGGTSAVEIVNPAWEDIQQEQLRLEIENAEAVAGKTKLEPYVKELETVLRDEEAQLTRLDADYGWLRNNLELAQNERDGYQKAYVQLKRDIYDTAEKLGPLRSRVARLEAGATAARAHIADVQSSITAGQTAMAQLETKDDTLARYVTLTLEKQHEAELAVAQPTLDVKVASEAIAPTKKIWPQRTLMALVMACVGLFGSVAAVCTRRYLVATGVWAGR
jgi:capsular polysaccharide biosynthesis protein